jgi:hypothetical protein
MVIQPVALNALLEAPTPSIVPTINIGQQVTRTGILSELLVPPPTAGPGTPVQYNLSASFFFILADGTDGHHILLTYSSNFEPTVHALAGQWVTISGIAMHSIPPNLPDKVTEAIQVTSIQVTTPPGPTATPIAIPEDPSRQPYHTMMNKALVVVRKIIPGAQLFQVRTSLTSAEIESGNISPQSVGGDFASPTDDIHLVEAGANKVNDTTWNYTTYNTTFANGCPASQGGFQPPPPPGCELTEVPEPHQYHLPITDWNIDGLDIANILRDNHFDPRVIVASTTEGVVYATITTFGRAKVTTPKPGYTNDFTRVLPQSSSLSYPDDKAIIVVTFFDDHHNGGGADYYIILSANNGSVLDRGVFPVTPLPP